MKKENIDSKIEKLQEEIRRLRKIQDAQEKENILSILRGTTWGVSSGYLYADNDATNDAIKSLDESDFGCLTKRFDLGGVNIRLSYDDGTASIGFDSIDDGTEDDDPNVVTDKAVKALKENGVNFVVNIGIKNRMESAQKWLDEARKEFIWATELVATLNRANNK